MNHLEVFDHLNKASTLSGLPFFLVLFLFLASVLAAVFSAWGSLQTLFVVMLDSYYAATNRGGIEVSGVAHLKPAMYERLVAYTLLAVAGNLLLFKNVGFMGLPWDLIAYPVLYFVVSATLPRLPWVQRSK